MNIKELKELPTPELKQELVNVLRERFNLRMQRGTGQLKQNHKFLINRRTVARIQTLLREREASRHE